MAGVALVKGAGGMGAVVGVGRVVGERVVEVAVWERGVGVRVAVAMGVRALRGRVGSPLEGGCWGKWGGRE